MSRRARQCVLLLVNVFVLQCVGGVITSLPGFGPVHGFQETGYLPVGDAFGSELFYWYVECNCTASSAPLVLWLNGGPGCPSTVGFFVENGPYRLVPGTLDLVDNPFSWHQVANMLYIDQPLGTGYSAVSTAEAYVTTEVQAADQLYHAIVHFITNAHPELSQRAFFVTGESYAGKWIPTLATRIVKANGNSSETSVNLHGIAIGDGFVDPLIQRFVYPDQAYAFGLLSPLQKQQLDAIGLPCKRLLLAGQYLEATQACAGTLDYILAVTGGIDAYDLRRWGAPFDRAQFVELLNLPALREAVNASSLVPELQGTKECNSTVAEHLYPVRLASVRDLLPSLMDHMRVLLYSGNFDLKDGPMGTEAYLSTLDWSGSHEFATASRDIWWEPQGVAGFSRTYANLTFLVVAGAGHFLPVTQPESALEMLHKFINNASFSDSASVAQLSAEVCGLLQQCNGNGVCRDSRCVCDSTHAGAACESSVIVPSNSSALQNVSVPAMTWAFTELEACTADESCDVLVEITEQESGSGALQLYAGLDAVPSDLQFAAADRSSGLKSSVKVTKPKNQKLFAGVANTGSSNTTYSMTVGTASSLNIGWLVATVVAIIVALAAVICAAVFHRKLQRLQKASGTDTQPLTSVQ